MKINKGKLKKTLVVFVCSSNIFRSQIAEAFFNKYSKKHKAQSAALIKPQEKMHKLVVRAMKDKGVDISKNKSKLLNKDMINEANLIILMNQNLKNLLQTTKKTEIWNIPDIIAGEDDESKYKEFIKTRDKIEEHVKNLVRKIG